MKISCPKCDADISETYEPDDYSCGIVGGFYCDVCDIGIGEHEISRDHSDDDVGIPPADPQRTIGTPLSEISGRPGHPGFEEFKRIAKSWGYD